MRVFAIAFAAAIAVASPVAAQPGPTLRRQSPRQTAHPTTSSSTKGASRPRCSISSG